jgi:hypothetical protein
MRWRMRRGELLRRLLSVKVQFRLEKRRGQARTPAVPARAFAMLEANPALRMLRAQINALWHL